MTPIEAVRAEVASDLLVALKDLLSALESDLPQVSAITTGPVAAARAAIAKAEDN